MANEENKTTEEPKISKAAAKKAEQKALKAQKKAEHQANKAVNAETLPVRPKQATAVRAGPDMETDPMDSRFESGWLKEVYEIAPVGRDVSTRFPPEPNGFLHIGHAKAIAVNFGFAKKYGGKCYLRYDDTNPAAEDQRYVDSIKEMIEWLGYVPFEVTYSSDRFDRLYELAEELIKRDKAYVCHCSKEETKKQRGGEDGKENPRYTCAHRTRPISESLYEFRAMRDGKYEPQTAFLRMKMAITESGNPNMWDLPAYRIPEKGKNIHHRTNNKWLIYPTYDFTHCLCDAMEHITHSMCTIEFRSARESYDWLVDGLKEHLPAIPQQREYGRLSITGTVLSKRKIATLVNKGIVRDWDDPRLFTLIALRRRGIPPGAIRAFVAELGVSDSTTIIQTVRLETVVRKYLERTVPRLFVVLDPVEVIIDDLPEDHLEDISIEFLKGDAKMGSHTVPFTRKLYIDRSDFREEDDPNFFRLAPGKVVGLLHVPHPIKCTSFDKSPSTGEITTIHATYLRPGSDAVAVPKPKSYIQWIAHSPAHSSPVMAEVRIQNPLFLSANPDAVEGGFLNDVATDSEDVYPNAMIECGFEEVRRRAPWPKDHVPDLHPGPWGVRFQGVRVAYFALDTDSKVEEGKIVLNKIVSLKEDAGKA